MTPRQAGAGHGRQGTAETWIPQGLPQVLLFVSPLVVEGVVGKENVAQTTTRGFVRKEHDEVTTVVVCCNVQGAVLESLLSSFSSNSSKRRLL